MLKLDDTFVKRLAYSYKTFQKPPRKKYNSQITFDGRRFKERRQNEAKFLKTKQNWENGLKYCLCSLNRQISSFHDVSISHVFFGTTQTEPRTLLYQGSI